MRPLVRVYDRWVDLLPDSSEHLSGSSLATDPESLARHFGGGGDLLSLWIAEPYVDTAPVVAEALERRARALWYGYESRPSTALEAFWSWMSDRHSWDGSDLNTSISPSVGTSIGVLLEALTSLGDGVILQPPVFTDFKPLVVSAGREVVRNPLVLTDDGYRMDLDDLAIKAADQSVKVLILCNPHNPVGRVWTGDELAALAEICVRNDVFVIADEIHADLGIAPHSFVPFASTAATSGVSWVSLLGPIKTFGLAGVCDSLLVTDDGALTERYRSRSSQLHLTRNNVFSLSVFEQAYRDGGPWVDDLLELTAANIQLLEDGLPDQIELIPPEGTYLGWLDFRKLGMEVPVLARWLSSSARLALSPGHWFGREGAGFARMTIAVRSEVIEEAIDRLGRAVGRLAD